MDLIDPSLGITLVDAKGINDKGQGVANESILPGVDRAYLLTPVPDPRTIALLAIALFGFESGHVGSEPNTVSLVHANITTYAQSVATTAPP